MTGTVRSDRPALAALVFRRGEDVNRIMADFAAGLASAGVRLGGVVQVADGPPTCECPDTHVVDLETGMRLPILQNLGREAKACRVDPGAIAVMGQYIAAAVARSPHLLIVNRFGRLESEGKGVRDEIAAAIADGIPTLVGVAARYVDAWRAFVPGLGEELACTPAAVEGWWQRSKAVPSRVCVQHR